MKKFKPLTWEKEPVLSKDLLKEWEELEDAKLCEPLKSWDDEPKQEIKYSEDEVRELLMKALTHTDYNLCGSLVTAQQEIRTANFNVWFEEYKKK